jgi:predicted glycogen debranching enzyme
MIDTWFLRIPWSAGRSAEIESLLTREWLVTNGLGGYASGTIAGVSTRRYHGLLIAALKAPLGRRMMFNHLTELIRLPDGKPHFFGGRELVGGQMDLHGMDHLTEFRLEWGLPVWRFEINDIAFEKRVFMPHRQNTVFINYRLVNGDGPVRLKLRPSVHFRSHDAAVSEQLPAPYPLVIHDNRYDIQDCQRDVPALRMFLHGNHGAFTVDGKQLRDILYRVEEDRGYQYQGDIWSPGYFRVDLGHDQEATLVASTDSWEAALALSPAEALQAEHERRKRLIQLAEPSAQEGLARQLVLAADQFTITPVGRAEEAARARATGDDVRSVIAGYHWFTDWGRDTMISLEGLTLVTGRHKEGGEILRTFATALRDGLLPNLFPEGEEQGLYHTADATLWFFHAIHRYLVYTGDRETLRSLLPKLQSVVEYHQRGTQFHIKVDSSDGLLSQGQEGYQLTWMDAKVGNWVVTPRRGKAVEINALWYNALRLLEGWLRAEGDGSAAEKVADYADQARQSFNRRFWYAEGGYLYDVIDGPNGDDASCRPNQVFAISLEHPILDRERWEPTMDVVSKRLLTPVGLRSLAPGSPDYKAKYFGDLRARDAAYHQGTVWSWLIGPYIDAWLKLHPDQQAQGRCFLQGLLQHLGEVCIGSISEVFDAAAPYTPRGCIAQAWGVAEVLRSWAKTAAEHEASCLEKAAPPVSVA